MYKRQDYYTGNKDEVSGGKVTFTPGTNGVILLESNSKKPAVNANPAGGDYYKKVSEGLEIKLTVGNADSGEYSINGGEKISYKNGDKITIGKGDEFGSKTTVELFASNDEGEAAKTFTLSLIHISFYYFLKSSMIWVLSFVLSSTFLMILAGEPATTCLLYTSKERSYVHIMINT